MCMHVYVCAIGDEGRGRKGRGAGEGRGGEGGISLAAQLHADSHALTQKEVHITQGFGTSPKGHTSWPLALADHLFPKC